MTITTLETIVREAYRNGPDTITLREEVGYASWILTLGEAVMVVGYDEHEPVEDPDDATAVMIDWTTYVDADMQDLDTQDGGTLGEARTAIAAWIDTHAATGTERTWVVEH